MNIEWFATLFALAAVLFTAAPLIRHQAWWIRAFEFPRVQIALVTAVVLIEHAVVTDLDQPRQITLVVLLSLCLALQLARIIPYTPVFGKQAKDAINPSSDDSISLLMANIWMPNREADALLHLIRAKVPDLVLVVETDS